MARTSIEGAYATKVSQTTGKKEYYKNRDSYLAARMSSQGNQEQRLRRVFGGNARY